MCNKLMSQHESKQQGSVLMVVLFIIVVMGLMAAVLTRISWSRQDMTTTTVLGSRAWLAAHSGNEIALNRLFPIGTSAADSSVCNATIVSGDVAIDESCFVNVGCTAVSSAEATYFMLQSTGECSSGKFQVSRVQEVLAKEPE